MGWQNTRQVEAIVKAQDPRVKGMSHGARVLLDVMATNALDDTGRPIYFRGWVHLAEQLGYPDYDNRAERTVARYVAELRTRDLAVPIAWRGGRGTRVYELHLLPRPASDA